jgi:ABC-type nitrate/sulfonate/bicarbonate transport system ATPase subunit
MPTNDVLAAFRGVRKTFDGETLVVRDLDLDIRRGEFLTLLGPSGSGKTTTLKMPGSRRRPRARSRSRAAASHACRRTGATSAWSSRTTRSFPT